MLTQVQPLHLQSYNIYRAFTLHKNRWNLNWTCALGSKNASFKGKRLNTRFRQSFKVKGTMQHPRYVPSFQDDGSNQRINLTSFQPVQYVQIEPHQLTTSSGNGDKKFILCFI